MNHLDVARKLLADAARLHRWSTHTSTATDRDVSEARAEEARGLARAAFALVAASTFPTVPAGAQMPGGLE